MSDNPDDGVGFGGDSTVEYSQQSWLGRLGGSFVAALIGLILFLGSFVLLFWNEGHAVAAFRSLDAGAHAVVSVPADKVNPANDGHLIHVSGMTAVARPLTDSSFHVGAANAMRLRRHVVMYQWEETKHTETHKEVGGSQTTQTTYSYKKTWSETAIDSTNFRRADGNANAHRNPSMPLHSADLNNPSVSLGGFRLDNSLLELMSGFKQLEPGPEAAASATGPSFQRVGDGFYHGASPDNPAIGDIKVTFEMIETQPVSVVAAQLGGTLAPYRGKDGRVIELVDLGTRDANDMFQEAKSAASTLTWILRGVGFVVMVIGLALLAAPLSWLASVLPFLSGVVDAAAFLVALIVAIPLTLTTIAVAWLVYRPLLGIGLIVTGAALAYGLRQVVPRRRLRVAGRA